MAAQKARLEVIVLQHSVEQMMQKHGGSNAGPSGQTTVHSEKPGDTDSDVDVIVCYSTLTNVTCRAAAAAHCTLFRHYYTVERRLTRLLLRCGPQIQTISCAIHHILLPG